MRIISDTHNHSLPIDNSLDARNGEEDKFWFRSDRFFSVANQWYFTTRENRDIGPFGTRDDAISGLKLFIECVENQHTEVDYAISVALQGEWAIVRYQ